jgi:hypothetical protein
MVLAVAAAMMADQYLAQFPAVSMQVTAQLV